MKDLQYLIALLIFILQAWCSKGLLTTVLPILVLKYTFKCLNMVIYITIFRKPTDEDE